GIRDGHVTGVQTCALPIYEEIRRIASYQQSFNEMTRGERFVQDVLRAKARALERWFVGLPAAIISFVGLGLLLRAFWRHRSPGRSEERRVGKEGRGRWWRA